MLNKGIIIAIAIASLAAGYFVAQGSQPKNPVIDDSVIFVYPQTRSLAEVSLTDMNGCLLYTSPSPRDRTRSRMPSSA